MSRTWICVARRKRGVLRTSVGRWLLLVAVGLAAQGSSAAESPARRAARELVNPLAFSAASVARGRAIYLRHCVECHDSDGRALSNTTYEAADLTAPETWIYGTTEGEIFVNIRDGVGDDMPPYRTILKAEEDLWHLVNFMRSLDPKAPEPVSEESGAG